MSNTKADLFSKCYSGAGNFSEHADPDEHYVIAPLLQGQVGPHMHFQDKPMIVWSVNDYLGLAQNPEIRKAAEEGAKKWSTTMPMGAPLMSGLTQEQLNLEKKLAKMAKKEEANLFVSGYLGILGTITGLIGPGDTVIIDQYSHACIIDGAFLAQARSGVKIKPFKHNDMKDLERQLKLARDENKGGILIVTEGVFGMRGDLCNLPEICALKEKYQAKLLMDDAHGLGVMGPNGGGTGEHYNLQDEIDLYFSTFAKSFVSIGGFTSGPKEVISYIKLNSRPAVFAKAMPLVLINTIDKAADIISDGQEKRQQMWHIATALQQGLRDIGYEIGPTQAPITPLYIRGGDHELAIKMLHMLRDEYQIFVTPVGAPVVPVGTVLFRMIPTGAHTDDDVQKTLHAFNEIRKRLSLN